MLHSSTFKRAQKVHDTVQQLVSHDKSAPTPTARRVVPIAQEMRHHLHHHTEPSAEVDELRTLLREPHVQALMFCHDRVSSSDYYLPRRHYPRIKQDPVDIILSSSVLNYGVPTSSHDNTLPLSRDVPSARKEDATIVYLQRTNRPLGCTIYKQGEAVFVGKLLKGCDAELSDVLREGDELLEVNGVPVSGRSTDEIVRLMSGEAGVTLAFTIIPVHDDNIDINYEPKYVRAHFHYSPKADEEIPCQPLGLKFERGDILEISNQDDPEWWQARKVFDDGAESLPGLIPARHRQQQSVTPTLSLSSAFCSSTTYMYM
jgi:MAGUK p55 subfamily protein 5